MCNIREKLGKALSLYDEPRPVAVALCGKTQCDLNTRFGHRPADICK
jgi:hypothetical protein